MKIRVTAGRPESSPITVEFITSAGALRGARSFVFDLLRRHDRDDVLSVWWQALTSATVQHRKVVSTIAEKIALFYVAEEAERRGLTLDDLSEVRIDLAPRGEVLMAEFEFVQNDSGGSGSRRRIMMDWSEPR